MRIILALLVLFSSCTSNTQPETASPIVDTTFQDSMRAKEIELMKKGPIRDYPYYDSSPVHPNHSK